METAASKAILCVLLIAASFSAGCGSPNASSAPVQMIRAEGVTTAQVMQAADEVLTGMHFSIEKLDVDQGVIRTRPLRGAQFFEFWRSDNASTFACEEANLQAIRRSVELQVRREPVDRRREAGGADGLQPAASSLRVQCDVSVQRLSLPGNEVASVSQAYQIHTRSTPIQQRLQVNARQRQTMAWVDMGRDPDLAARILQRIERRIERMD
ncbi:MAG: hypothetical protein A2Y76_14495 [Planctomycetes bacterium RBG_13_60_9]|nr:MAG: hypothetical protein A2Y76_14495 [Planctomycetes bacterium RBG_13_60_9]